MVKFHDLTVNSVFSKFLHKHLSRREKFLRQENSRQIRVIQIKCRDSLTVNVTSPTAKLQEYIAAGAGNHTQSSWHHIPA